jgi:Tfp pilus assembly protein PilN
MIKINLLESAKGKGKRGGGGGPSMPSVEMGDMGSPKLKVLVVLIVAGLLNLVYWYRLDHQAKAIAVQMKVAELKNKELADVKARFLERQTQANNYKRRVDVIDGLRSGQAGPVNLLAMLGETVNNTEAVWLSKMDDSGPSVNLEGTALSTDAVANLIANLQKTGFFKNVEIKETFQDDAIKDMQAFQFTLTCEKGGASDTQSSKGKS